MFQTPVLNVNLGAIIANWHTLRGSYRGEETAAVVKADAYGLGMVEVATGLSAAGCNTFFVATLEEGVKLRAALGDVRILVFHGVGKGEEFAFVSHRLIPVLNSQEQIQRWKPVAAEHVHAVSALHIDTAMGRLGLQPEEFVELMKKDPTMPEACRVGLIMSHLACAPDKDHPMNAAQLDAFTAIIQHAPGIPASLCNSGGMCLDQKFHFHLARPGCSLYGVAPQSGVTVNPMRQAVSWEAPIIMTRTLAKEQAIGYGSTYTAKKGTRIVTIASGYADGYLRYLSNNSVAYIGDHQVKLIGRVTMDMLTFDVTHVPESLTQEGMKLELLGERDGIRVDDLANAAGTIGYEILTRIGNRVARRYSL